MTQDAAVTDLQHEYETLGFDLRLCWKYHCERVRFFEALSRWTTVGSLLLASAAGAVLFKGAADELAVWLAFAVAALSAFDLAVGFQRRISLHSDLVRQWVELENEWRHSKATAPAIARLQSKRRLIEVSEPPQMEYLVTRCHIALDRAEGKPEENWPGLTWYQHLFAHVLPELPHRRTRSATRVEAVGFATLVELFKALLGAALCALAVWLWLGYAAIGSP